MNNHFPAFTGGGPNILADYATRLHQQEVERCVVLSHEAKYTHANWAVLPLPPKVDHSQHISYIRNQGAYGCFANAIAACMDITFTKHFWPHFHPNVSVNRMLWVWGDWILQKKDAPGLGDDKYSSLNSYLYHFGCSTEGTELSDSDGVQWPTDEGNYECPNYRLGTSIGSGTPLVEAILVQMLLHDYEIPIKVGLKELKSWLQYVPMRVSVMNDEHFVALVGYDDTTSRFKFINSWGDLWGENGFGYIDYNKLDQEISSAQVYPVKPPLSVPCAKIRFRSQYRQDINLWLGVEGKMLSKCIWPTRQRQDTSHNLSLIVTLPRGFAWPPSPENRVFLRVYDSGAHSNAGGSIDEFTVGFSGQYHYCTEIAHGPANNIVVPGDQPVGGAQWHTPKSFKPGQLLQLTIP